MDDQKQPKRSRRSREPNGKLIPPENLSPRDIKIFKLLDPDYRYQYLPSHWIYHLVGGKNWIKLKQRLGDLYRRPNCYLERPLEQWRSFNSGYKHAVYRRDTAAVKVVRDRGVAGGEHQHNPNLYAHELLNCLVDASIEYGVKADPKLSLLTWVDLQHDERVPEATRRSQHPFRIPIAGQMLIPDGRPFIIQNEKKMLCIPAKEIDRHSEPLSPTKLRNSSIAKKLQQYKHFFDRGLYRTHYGFPNAVVLFVTINQKHMENMMALCRQIMGKPCSYLLFKTVPDWAYEPHFEAPNGWMLTEPWKRVRAP